MSNRSTLLLEHHLEELKLPTLKSDVGLDEYETAARINYGAGSGRAGITTSPCACRAERSC